jgi:hypothetical protein
MHHVNSHIVFKASGLSELKQGGKKKSDTNFAG